MGANNLFVVDGRTGCSTQPAPPNLNLFINLPPQGG